MTKITLNGEVATDNVEMRRIRLARVRNALFCMVYINECEFCCVCIRLDTLYTVIVNVRYNVRIK